jgi:hypothetical protein
MRRIADYLDAAADELYGSHYDPKVDQPTPQAIRLEIDKVRRWIAKLRRAAEQRDDGR